MKERNAKFSGTLAGLMGEVADEFTERLHRGEQPDVEAYAAQYPELATIIRQVFPALAALQADAESPDTNLPLCLGEYRLIREIGRGGMAVVYEAEQQSLARRVALKVLPLAAVLDPRQLQRFRNEAQAAALLHHTNIVPVFSVGCEQGVHYYAMQYIEGKPLSAVIEELRELTGKGESEVMSPRDFGSDSSILALGLASDVATSGGDHPITHRRSFFQAVSRLGVEAAEALQHAHEHGIVHRDIKPSNLLLDADGKLWITDFGLALTQTNLSLTLPGDLVGTIRYMSPEQAIGRSVPLDHRTDIYSLGCTLYELLCLAPAFGGSNRQELLRQIANADPRPMRHRNPALPRELDVIIAKAMAKEPRDRYQRASELADDLRRFLHNKPILARPPSLLDRMSKWSRRHRAVVLAGCTCLALAVIGLTVSTVLVARARSEAVRQRDTAQALHDKAKAAQQQADAQRQRAELNFTLAREAVDRMLTRMAGEMADMPRMQDAQRKLLLDALQFYQQFVQQRADDPLVRLEAARACARVAQIHEILGDHAQAQQSYEQAVSMLAGLSKAYPADATDAHELARTQHALGQLLWKIARSADAENAETQAIATSRELCAHSALPEYREDLAAALAGLGHIAVELNRRNQAAPPLDEALQIYRELVKAKPLSPEDLAALARVQADRASLFADSEDSRNTAIEALREAAMCQEQVVHLRNNGLERAALTGYVMRLGDLMNGSGKRPRNPDRVQALQSLQQLESELSKEARDYPDVLHYRAEIGDNQRRLAMLLMENNKLKEAEELLKRAIPEQTKLVSEFPDVQAFRWQLENMYLGLGVALRHQWRVHEAEQAYEAGAREARTLLTQVPGHTAYVHDLRVLESELDGLRNTKDAGEIANLGRHSLAGVVEAVARARHVDFAHSSMQRMARQIYTEYLIIGGEYQRAADAQQQTVRDFPQERDSNMLQKTLGWALLMAGHPAEAQAAFRLTIAEFPVWTPPSAKADPDLWTAAYFLGMVTKEQYVERWKDVSMWGREYGPFPWFYVGQRCEAEGRVEEAKAAYRTATELGDRPNAHHTAYWAAYRLQVLTGGLKSSSPAP